MCTRNSSTGEHLQKIDQRKSEKKPFAKIQTMPPRWLMVNPLQVRDSQLHYESKPIQFLRLWTDQGDWGFRGGYSFSEYLNLVDDFMGGTKFRLTFWRGCEFFTSSRKCWPVPFQRYVHIILISWICYGSQERSVKWKMKKIINFTHTHPHKKKTFFVNAWQF